MRASEGGVRERATAVAARPPARVRDHRARTRRRAASAMALRRREAARERLLHGAPPPGQRAVRRAYTPGSALNNGATTLTAGLAIPP